MPRTSPKTTSTRTRPAPAPAAGGGSTAKATEWVTMSLNPADWTVIKNGSANNADCTLTKVGANLVADFGTSRSYNLGGTTNNGISMISKQHILPWSNHSSGEPPGSIPTQQIQTEAVNIKIEVRFDDANGPWNGDAGNNYGYYMITVAGLVSYQTDQSGSPGLSGWIYRGAQVRKTTTQQPSAVSGTNNYRGGYKTYFGWADKGYYEYKCQAGTPATGHDALVFSTGTNLRSGASAENAITQAGTYCTTDLFGPMNQNGYSFQDGSTVYANPASNFNFFHFWIFFGSHVNNRSGICKINRIRYCIQPLPSRTDT